jgi:hypothetical protein
VREQRDLKSENLRAHDDANTSLYSKLETDRQLKNLTIFEEGYVHTKGGDLDPYP